MFWEFVFNLAVNEGQAVALQGKTAESYANLTLILRLSYAKIILLSRGVLSFGNLSGCIKIGLT